MNNTKLKQVITLLETTLGSMSSEQADSIVKIAVDMLKEELPSPFDQMIAETIPKYNITYPICDHKCRMTK